MQALDAVTLKALAVDLQSQLDHAKVSKVQHPSAREFLITFWGGAIRSEQRNVFYINLSPDAPFCALITTKQRQATVLNEFEKPTALCMLLRKHLSGASLLGVTTLPGERVLNLVFENFNELGNKVRLILSLELMGKHTNMIFYDDVQGVILAVAHGVSESMSRYRELAAGLPYAPPPRPAGKRLLSTLTLQDFETLWQQKPPSEKSAPYLNRQLAGWGLHMLNDALAQLPTPPKAHDLYHHLCRLEEGRQLTPAISQQHNRFTLIMHVDAASLGTIPAKDNATQTPPHDWHAYDTINELVCDYFLAHVRQRRLARKREQLHTIVHNHLRKLHRRENELKPTSASAALQGDSTEFQTTHTQTQAALPGLAIPTNPPGETLSIQDNPESQETETQSIERLQATGDRILAAYSAGEVPRNGPTQETEISVIDYETGAPWIIAIDPRLGWVENAQRYYRQAQKAKARQEAYAQLSVRIQEDREFLESLQQLIAHADTLAELEALALDVEAAVHRLRTGEPTQADLADGREGKGGRYTEDDSAAPRHLPSQAARGNRKKGKQKPNGKASKSKTEKGLSGKAASGILTLTSSDGLELLLGKSAQGNEAIVGKLSRANDLWLHVHQMPGSHVLIRTGQPTENQEMSDSDETAEALTLVPNQTLLEAATLAAYYSSARHSVNIPVIYTPCKFVRKIPHSYPGHVNYRHEKTIFITPDPALLATLLQMPVEALSH